MRWYLCFLSGLAAFYHFIKLKSRSFFKKIVRKKAKVSLFRKTVRRGRAEVAILKDSAGPVPCSPRLRVIPEATLPEGDANVPGVLPFPDAIGAAAEQPAGHPVPRSRCVLHPAAGSQCGNLQNRKAKRAPSFCGVLLWCSVCYSLSKDIIMYPRLDKTISSDYNTKKSLQRGFCKLQPQAPGKEHRHGTKNKTISAGDCCRGHAFCGAAASFFRARLCG